MLLQYPGEPWYVIGHSMGAAMATLCALDLRFRLQPVPDVSAATAANPEHHSVQSEQSFGIAAHGEGMAAHGDDNV